MHTFSQSIFCLFLHSTEKTGFWKLIKCHRTYKFLWKGTFIDITSDNCIVSHKSHTVLSIIFLFH